MTGLIPNLELPDKAFSQLQRSSSPKWEANGISFRTAFAQAQERLKAAGSRHGTRDSSGVTETPADEPQSSEPAVEDEQGSESSSAQSGTREMVVAAAELVPALGGVTLDGTQVTPGAAPVDPGPAAGPGLGELQVPAMDAGEGVPAGSFEPGGSQAVGNAVPAGSETGRNVSPPATQAASPIEDRTNLEDSLSRAGAASKVAGGEGEPRNAVTAPRQTAVAGGARGNAPSWLAAIGGDEERNVSHPLQRVTSGADAGSGTVPSPNVSRRERTPADRLAARLLERAFGGDLSPEGDDTPVAPLASPEELEQGAASSATARESASNSRRDGSFPTVSGEAGLDLGSEPSAQRLDNPASGREANLFPAADGSVEEAADQPVHHAERTGSSAPGSELEKLALTGDGRIDETRLNEEKGTNQAQSRSGVEHAAVVSAELEATEDEIEPPQAALVRRFEGVARSALEQMVRRVDGEVDGDYASLRFQLLPGRLGELELKLEVDRGILSARFVAASEEVRALIESALPDLRRNLSDLGVAVNELSVFVGQEQSGRENAAGHEPGVRPAVSDTVSASSSRAAYDETAVPERASGALGHVGVDILV